MPTEATPFELFAALLDSLRDHKPNDRSDQDRYWAIVITDVEKAAAVFSTYCDLDTDNEDF